MEWWELVSSGVCLQKMSHFYSQQLLMPFLLLSLRAIQRINYPQFGLLQIIRNYMNNDNFSKRNTFQGIINAEREKVPEKSSRSKSKSRSKANSISRSISGTQLSSRSWTKTEGRHSNMTEQSRIGSDNIVGERKRRVEQELMKKIIKLKNTSIKLDSLYKEHLSTNKQPSEENCNPNRSPNKFQGIQIRLDQFNMQIQRQVSQVGDRFMERLEGRKDIMGQIEAKLPEYTFLPMPSDHLAMPSLEVRLIELQSRWEK